MGKAVKAGTVSEAPDQSPIPIGFANEEGQPLVVGSAAEHWLAADQFPVTTDSARQMARPSVKSPSTTSQVEAVRHCRAGTMS